MKSETINLSKEMAALLEQSGINEPTPIQTEVIPAIFVGKDVIAQSETGSGKTLSFAIPIIERMHRRDGLKALVVCPTRELAVQITKEFIKFSHGKHLGVTPVYGGVSIKQQVQKILRTNIIIGTPGRLVDLINRGLLDLAHVSTLVFDEADRMLDMGFIKDINTIIHKVPSSRQTLMFSATLAPEVIALSKRYMNNPLHVQLASSVKPELLRQTYYQSSPERRLPLLIELLQAERDLALVFCNRKHITTKIARQLAQNGVDARCLNGNMTQGQRERTIGEFRNKKFSVLVATDVAARGLHIDDITHVYNYEIPRDVETYTHRIGRTARAGAKGRAISLVATGEDRDFFQRILFSYKGNITLKEDPGHGKGRKEEKISENREHGETPRRLQPRMQHRAKKHMNTTRKRKAHDHTEKKMEQVNTPSDEKSFLQPSNDSSQDLLRRKREEFQKKRKQKTQPQSRPWDKRSFGEMLRRKKKKRLYTGG